MMNPDAIKGGGSAYPYKVVIEGPGYDPVTQKDVPSGTTMHHHFSGMTLRDHFAGLVMQGLCANPGGPFQANPMCGWGIVNCTPDDVAGRAYDLADAMIKARG